MTAENICFITRPSAQIPCHVNSTGLGIYISTRNYTGTPPASPTIPNCNKQQKKHTEELTYPWNVLGSKQIQRLRIAKCHMAATWRSCAFACYDLGKRLPQFDSIARMASNVKHYECDRIGSLRVRAMRPIGMVLLQGKWNIKKQSKNWNEWKWNENGDEKY